MEHGEKLGRDPLHSVGIIIFGINLGRAALGEILIIHGNEHTSRRNFYINVGRTT
jgi:hypothetical protein